MQEAVLPKILLVYLGQRLIVWDSFASTTLRFLSGLSIKDSMSSSLDECYANSRKKEYSHSTRLGLSMVNSIISLREWRHNSSTSIPPSELVFLCKDLRATVPSDMVYGVSGLFESAAFWSQKGAMVQDRRLPSTIIYRLPKCTSSSLSGAYNKRVRLIFSHNNDTNVVAKHRLRY